MRHEIWTGEDDAFIVHVVNLHGRCAYAHMGGLPREVSRRGTCPDGLLYTVSDR